MRRPIAVLALLTAFLPALLSAAADRAPLDEVRQAADALLAAAYPADGPGAAVLVKWKGEIVLRKGYGMAQMDLGVPVVPEQVFEIGSVTKQFTAAVVLRLAEQGRLSLSDPLTEFLPDATFGGATITLEQLLAHTAGVPNYTDMPEWIPRWREDMNLETLMALFESKPLDFPPGTLWSYSNSGYVLLGAVIEKVTGKSYEEVVESELFAALGMTDSRYGHQEEIVRGRVAGYVKGPEGWANAPYLSLTQPYAAGSLMSTVDDLARWSDALEAGRVISPASRDRMFTSAVLRGGDQDGVATRYGLGNAMTEVAGRPTHEHGGGIHGFTCDLLRVPGEELLVVILSNNPTQDTHDLAHRVAESVLGVPQKEKPAPLKLSAAELDAYIGVYLVPERSGVRRIVSRDGETLRLQRTGGDLRTLVPIGPDAFETADSGTPVRFARGAGGSVVALMVDQGIGPVFRSLRTDEPVPPPLKEVAVDSAAYAALVGVYALAPGFDIAITQEGDHLFAQATGQEKLEIYPESTIRFFFKLVDAQIDFVLENGRATSLTLHQGGQHLPAPRKP
ncbi:MAG: serine hydrolase [Thermoanaerobaculia bacterium]|nr:serine hydrolase [Thermoanaerobaculia bacterium]MBP9823517.1 serine hydrolase [Thermoanaerobaculia bacterium]